MARINENNYVERRSGLCKRCSWRDWWLGKDSRVELNVVIPQRLYGKRFRIKVEVIEDKKRLKDNGIQ